MKIAIPINRNNSIESHFGKCENYNVYTISETSSITNIQTISSDNSCGCKSNIAITLAESGVKIMLAGGIGAGAINTLNKSGIEVIRGCEGNAETIIKQYIVGNIKDSGSSCQTHEQHHGSEDGGHNHLYNPSCNHN